ncbi:MAG: YcgN family cysteine cluster protein [Pseudomonadota bacterium]
MTAEPKPFWQTKSLAQMTRAEWESLCDGCGRCCVVTLEDDDEPGVIAETSIHCALFDKTCRRCRDYERRAERVPSCVTLTPNNIAGLSFMPSTCAYRRLAEGKGLAPWHPLVSGTFETVVEAGVAVAAAGLTDEADVHDDELWDYVTHFRKRF